MNTAFSLAMLYYTVGGDILIDAAMILYLVLTWVATIYLAAKRKKLEL
jgi:multisubunit Na+/H+ antiporter MnhF subunit